MSEYGKLSWALEIGLINTNRNSYQRWMWKNLMRSVGIAVRPELHGHMCGESH